MTENETTGARRGTCFCSGTGPDFTEFVRGMWSEEACNHFRNSRVEFLKGLRKLIDDRLERLTKQDQKGTTVPVE